MGKAVEHSRVLAELLHSQTVVFLIQEETSFLAVLDIDEIVDTILDDFHAGVKRLGEKSFHTLHAFLLTHFCITSLKHAADLNPVSCQNLLQQADDRHFHFVDTKCQRLNDQHIGEFIHYESRQEVCLAKDQAAARCVCHFFAVFPGILHSFSQKCFIDFLVDISCHHTDADFGMLVDETSSHRVSVEVAHQHDISVFICS